MGDDAPCVVEDGGISRPMLAISQTVLFKTDYYARCVLIDA